MPLFLSPRHLIADRFVIRTAVSAIRNGFTRMGDRQPLAVAPGERVSSRISMQAPVCVIPAIVDDDWVRIPDGENSEIAASSQSISLRGVGLAHTLPLPGRHAIVRFNPPAERPVFLVIELAWSHPQADGSFLSGARILGLIDSTEPCGA